MQNRSESTATSPVVSIGDALQVRSRLAGEQALRDINQKASEGTKIPWRRRIGTFWEIQVIISSRRLGLGYLFNWLRTGNYKGNFRSNMNIVKRIFVIIIKQ